MTFGMQAAVASSSGAAVSTGLAGGFVAAMKGVPAVAATTSTAGILGGLLGMTGGLFGGWLGSWIPAQFSPTNRERQHQLRVGRRMFFVCLTLSLIYVASTLIPARMATAWVIVGIVIGWICLLSAYIATEIVCLIWTIRRIRVETTPESDPNNSWLKAYVQRHISTQWEGRIYRSQTTIFGLPLIDIQVSNPSTSGELQIPKTARGWIAIGDRADGILLAIGCVARGGVAFGGVSIGLFSFGGVSLGIVSMGGVALGAVAFGGLALGGIAIGGLAIGWQAGGGGAVAWDVASGGGAIAHHAAQGGAALARDYAIGGAASATHANDAAAKAVLENHWLVRSMEWYVKNNVWLQIVVIAGSVVPSFAFPRLMYRKRPIADVRLSKGKDGLG